MERFTERKTDCWIKTKSGKDYTNKTQDYDAMLKLADYEDYDEKGLLLRLPFKLGDTYYRLLNGKIYANEFTCLSTIITFMENHDFGRTVFSTYEEAERAKKRQEKDKEIKRNLPCSIGTTIYMLVDWEDGAYQRIKNDIVKGYYLDDKEELYLIPTYLWHDQPISEIGKTIFLSEEEAKKALHAQREQVKASSKEKPHPRYTIEQTSDAFADPFIIRDNWAKEGMPDQYYHVLVVYQTFESEEEAQAYLNQLTQEDNQFEDKKSRVEQVIQLYKNTPDGLVIDSDTILKDVCDHCDMSENGLSIDVLSIWMNAKTQEERTSIENVFLAFTGVGFSDYLNQCLKETTRI